LPRLATVFPSIRSHRFTLVNSVVQDTCTGLSAKHRASQPELTWLNSRLTLSPLQAACCALGLSPPVRAPGSRNANAGDQKFRCLRRSRVSKFPPECVPQMLARRVRGSGGDNPRAQQVACKNSGYHHYDQLAAARACKGHRQHRAQLAKHAASKGKPHIAYT